MKIIIIKSIFISVIILFNSSVYSQENSEYNNNPFSIYKFNNQVNIAGSVNTFIYSNYYGVDVHKESYSDVHIKPEYLVYELFNGLKNKDIQKIGDLYDTSFNAGDFDLNDIAGKLRDFNDIRFVSKFKLGDLIVVRYNFVSAHDEYPYFAMIHRNNEKYYFSMDVNVSDPFNIIGSFSPYNLFERTDEQINTANMTPFYFIEKESKVYFTNQLPADDFAVLYLNLEFYTEGFDAPESEFIKTVQQVANSADSTQIMNLVDPGDLNLLSQVNYRYYLYAEIIKIFKNFEQITPIASLSINGGKIVFLKFGLNGYPSSVYSIALKEVSGKYFLALKIDDNTINNILQNSYIKEAVYNYFKNK